MNGVPAWLQAARPLAQVNILVPLLFGQAMAFAATGRFGLGWLWACAWLGLLVQLLIVFANDYADRDTDARNATFARFSGGSRVLPEGRLTPGALRGAALGVLGVLVVVSGGLAVVAGRPWMPVFVVATALLVWAYNFSPLRLAYRGHGEVVQGLGTGVVLPLLGYYAQAGEFAGFVGWSVAPMVLLGAVGNIDHGAAGLPVGSGERQAHVSGQARAVAGAAARARAAGDLGGVQRAGAAGDARRRGPAGGAGARGRGARGAAARQRRRRGPRRVRAVRDDRQRRGVDAHLLVLVWCVGFVVVGLRGGL
jgi:hypothetical protein